MGLKICLKTKVKYFAFVAADVEAFVHGYYAHRLFLALLGRNGHFANLTSGRVFSSFNIISPVNRVLQKIDLYFFFKFLLLVKALDAMYFVGCVYREWHSVQIIPALKRVI
jgi:hypothetical protein